MFDFLGAVKTNAVSSSFPQITIHFSEYFDSPILWGLGF